MVRRSTTTSQEMKEEEKEEGVRREEKEADGDTKLQMSNIYCIAHVLVRCNLANEHPALGSSVQQNVYVLPIL